MLEWIVSLGTWNWFILAALLLLIEVMAPGMFMLWLGLAACMVGIIALAVVWTWQAQLIAFAVLAIAAVPAWRRLAHRVEAPGDSPFLNRRTEGYVGHVFTLDRPIINGIGAVRINDTVWRVEGPDCPAGSRVRVARAEGANLVVEAA
ncbi:MAG: NfeD family protein [Hyphomicrobiales bacterium]|nr:NfeD family protein [Hyphomicrobiales bacterium]